jgi:serine/threonine protein kinase
MEYIEGKTLDGLLGHGQQRFLQERVIKLFKQILFAFSYAHKQGIIHRDIKPSNVIVSTDDVAKILDFGIAKIISNEAKLTRPGTKIGSLYYMSPEQVLGKEIDLRSDIYSLGILLYEMLSGRMPYTVTTETDYEIMEKIVKEQIPPIRNVNPEISQELENIIFKSCEKNPEFRFENCDEFYQALKKLKEAKMTQNYQSTQFINPSKLQIYNAFSQGQNKIYSQSQSVKSQPLSNRTNLIIIVSGIFITIIVTILMIYYLFLNKGESDNTISQKTNKENLTTEKNTSQGNTQTNSQSQNLNPNQNQRNNINSSVPGLYPEGSIRTLDMSDLTNKNCWELKILRNEIYARHGYIFRLRKDLVEYFNKQSWYNGTKMNVEQDFSQIEKNNVLFIKNYENQLGCK